MPRPMDGPVSYPVMEALGDFWIGGFRSCKLLSVHFDPYTAVKFFWSEPIYRKTDGCRTLQLNHRYSLAQWIFLVRWTTFLYGNCGTEIIFPPENICKNTQLLTHPDRRSSRARSCRCRRPPRRPTVPSHVMMLEVLIVTICRRSILVTVGQWWTSVIALGVIVRLFWEKRTSFAFPYTVYVFLLDNMKNVQHQMQKSCHAFLIHDDTMIFQHDFPKINTGDIIPTLRARRSSVVARVGVRRRLRAESIAPAVAPAGGRGREVRRTLAEGIAQTGRRVEPCEIEDVAVRGLRAG